MPFSARIAVTHTCRHWRLAALAYPSLWMHPRFYSAITLSWDTSFGGNDTVERIGSTGVANFSCASEILARSKDLSLHITLDVLPLDPAHSTIQDLGLVLSRSSHHIASITARAASPEAADCLMWELPALLRLALQTWKPATDSEVYDVPLYALMQSDLSAANLENVQLLLPQFGFP